MAKSTRKTSSSTSGNDTVDKLAKAAMSKEMLAAGLAAAAAAISASPKARRAIPRRVRLRPRSGQHRARNPPELRPARAQRTSRVVLPLGVAQMLVAEGARLRPAARPRPVEATPKRRDPQTAGEPNARRALR